MKRNHTWSRVLAGILCSAFLLSGCSLPGSWQDVFSKQFRTESLWGRNGEDSERETDENGDLKKPGTEDAGSGKKEEANAGMEQADEGDGASAGKTGSGKEGRGPEACAPEENITRAQFMVLLAKHFRYDLTETGAAGYVDVPEDHWAYESIASGRSHGILPGTEAAFYPNSKIDRGTAVQWVVNATGLYLDAENPYSDVREPELKRAVSVAAAKGFLNGYEDHTFRPEEFMTGQAAEAFITAAADYKHRDFAIREDASNTVELQEGVQYAVSGPETNVPSSIDAASRTVTLQNIDDAVRNLTPGQILYINPCRNFPEGFLAKADSIQVEGSTAVIACSQPALAEVIHKADISANFTVDAGNYRNDGEMTAVGGLDQIVERIEEQEEARRQENERRGETSAGESSASAETGAAETSPSAGNPAEESSPAETTSPADSPAETTRAGSAASSGAAETTAASGAAVETDFEADGYAETYLNYNDGHTIWSVWGGASESGSVVFKTAGFESKNGFYASLTLTLDACADMQILADNMEITYFDVSTKVNTAVNALAGYHMGGSAQPRIQLPTCVIPVSGPITMTVKPYLVVNAEGEFTVEATADLTNDIGFHYTYLNGSSDLETVNDTNVVVDFKAEAEGSLETGPEFQVDLGLCGTPFFDGAAVISGTGFSGFGISGKTAVEQQVSVSNQSAGYRGHQTALDADGNRHVCLLCIQGDAYMVDRLTIGLGEEINEVIKKLVNKEITYQVPELVHVLTPWHYSAGIDYGPEFELQKCPHIAYPITLTALDEELQEPLEGVNILVSGEPEALVTAADGTAQLWKENGVYHVTASLEHYEPNPLKGSVTVAAGKESKALYLKARVEGVVVSGPIGEYDGVTYSERTVPGLTRLSVKPEKERYVCSFAFYKDRLYYACKDAGTSDYSSAIYSCRPDGSDQKLLVEYPGTWDLNGHYENYDTCTEFVILDDCLYPGSREEQCIDLNTLESRPSDQPSDRLARRYFQKRIPMFSYAEDVTYYVSWELGDRKEIHRIRNGEDQVIWRESSWISLLGADRDSLYFSTSNGQEVTLYRLDIHQMQKSAMDSHMEAGGGGYFNW